MKISADKINSFLALVQEKPNTSIEQFNMLIMGHETPDLNGEGGKLFI